MEGFSEAAELRICVSGRRSGVFGGRRGTLILSADVERA
jgi:hypothetical protein